MNFLNSRFLSFIQILQDFAPLDKKAWNEIKTAPMVTTTTLVVKSERLKKIAAERK